MLKTEAVKSLTNQNGTQIEFLRKRLLLLIYIFLSFLSYCQDDKLKTSDSSIVLRDTVFNFVFGSITHHLGNIESINENDDDSELSKQRVINDIKQLKEEENDFFDESREEIDINVEEISFFKLNNLRLALLNTNRDFSTFSPIPLKENRVNLLLLYSKNGTDWKLDTVFTTYADFYPILDSSGYFIGESQRCTEGRCEWYKVIQKITNDNQLKTVFEYENFNRIMYLEDVVLPENRELVTREIGNIIQDETEILEYIWNKEKLIKIRIKQTKGVLSKIENDSLIIKFNITSQIVTLKNS